MYSPIFKSVLLKTIALKGEGTKKIKKTYNICNYIISTLAALACFMLIIVFFIYFNVV